MSNVDPTPFPGFAITANTSAREIVADLQKVFPIDAAESGFEIIFSMLNKRASQIWNRNDLGTHQDTEPLPASQEIAVASDYDFPYRVNLKYQEPARAFSPNTLYAMRQNTPSLSVEDLDVTIALDRATAQKCVSNYLMNRMMARRSYTMQLPRQYATAEPTDVVKIAEQGRPDPFRPVLRDPGRHRRERRGEGNCSGPRLRGPEPRPDRPGGLRPRRRGRLRHLACR